MRKPANRNLPTASYYLLIDTSTSRAQIALAFENKIIVQKTWQASGGLSEKLLLDLDKLFKRANLESENLSGIIVYLGPGSFTGLRIGVATANSLSYGLEIPQAGIKGKAPGAAKFNLSVMKPADLEMMLRDGIKIIKNKKGKIVLTPFYGKEPKIG